MSSVSRLGEGQVLLNSPYISVSYESCLAQLALALAGLFLKDVTLALMAAQYLPRSGNLESLGYCLACFVDTTFAGHGEGSLMAFAG